MNISAILAVLNSHEVDYMVIGGVNFLLRHNGPATTDLDIWIDDQAANRHRCERALGALQAEWGESDATWGPVVIRAPAWLDSQSVYCVGTNAGALNVFRAVPGLSDWFECHSRAILETTKDGTPYYGIADEDMLRCQMVISQDLRKSDRVAVLERKLAKQ
ncbi:MAG: hypothetical protein K8T25_02640 [Planctomycetia bacterium]|nr:hypothetical protein [Planctomycetia bacterium]